MNNFMNKKSIAIGFILCILLEIFVYQVNHKLHLFKPLVVVKTHRTHEMRGDRGVFTNTLIECVNDEDRDAPSELNISKSKLQDLVNSEISKNKLLSMSVYIRDLNNGPWIGINDQDEFIGGSLLKVPILISYLKLADNDSSILEKEIEYKNKIENNDQYYLPSKELEVGKKYKIQELLEYMIKYSDNNAAYLLYINLNKKDFDATFETLGFGDPDPNKPYQVNTVSYAGFFRILYNTSYLSKKNSERALQLLSQVEFNRGINSGLPKDIVVSHKFGIRSDGPINQLHDCGIVYYPKHPYLLCVMSKGGKFPDMERSITEVSKFVYEEVSINHH